MKPIPPTVRALDADGSEFFMDSTGRAFRADSSRVPELDGPPSPTLDRAEVVRVLAAAWIALQATLAWNLRDPKGSRVRNDSRLDEMRGIEASATALGIRAEFDALVRGGGA